MQVTRREIVDELLGFVGELGDADARSTAHLVLNRALERLWLKHPWRQFWTPRPTQITTVAGQRAYPLPDYFGRVGSRQGRIINISTGHALSPIAPDDEADANPTGGTALETRGDPSCYTIGGTAGVSTQPATAGEAVTVASSDASDTDIEVSIEGLDAAGRYVRAHVTLTGAVAVACGTFAEIHAFSKAWPSALTPAVTYTSSRGTVTLAGASSGTLETLQPTESAREHRLFVLSPTPSASGEVIAIPTLRAQRRLLYDSDQLPAHWSPAVFEEMLVQWQVNAGDLTSDATVARPAFLDLVGWDQTGSMPITERIRPWGGR